MSGKTLLSLLWHPNRKLIYCFKTDFCFCKTKLFINCL
nr:MAG TPA: hypothetical protein [Caudoviricetes sp.]